MTWHVVTLGLMSTAVVVFSVVAGALIIMVITTTILGLLARAVTAGEL